MELDIQNTQIFRPNIKHSEFPNEIEHIDSINSTLISQYTYAEIGVAFDRRAEITPKIESKLKTSIPFLSRDKNKNLNTDFPDLTKSNQVNH